MPVIKDRNLLLDFIRGVAAILVCAGHLRAALFVDFSNLSSSSYLDKFFYFITGFGHESVIIFFVLSGYLVGGSVLEKSNIDWIEYLSKRIFRLWVVLIPALFFTFLVDICIELLNKDVLSGAQYVVINSGPNSDHPYSSGIIIFISNLFFLQNINMPIFGSNGPLWSLSNEFWYYILFPVLLMLYRAEFNQKLIYLTISLLLILWLPLEVLKYFLVWVFGVVAFYLNKKNHLNSRMVYISILAFGMAMVLSRVGAFSSVFLSDVIIGIMFSLTITCQFKKNNNKFMERIVHFFSDISYTLYLFHFPLVILAYTVFFFENQMMVGLESVCIYMSIMLVILLISYIAWYLFERNTVKIQCMVIKKIKKKKIIRL
ncbi:acyltransferase family protein [Vibrio diazotrophicus]|uniref:acyltransferase family protein n=1 Tax=Vibrio diazotrophicus TaxID=685 RepID=UPI000C9E3EBA|nr:acyltransferase [Vibrio diazotrophicus]PNH94606.1 hypothetical protein C1M59_00780 [Vibrio diazotrophicus]